MREDKSTKEMADILHISTKTLLDWAAQGRVPCVRLSSRLIKFNEAAVLAALGVPESSTRQTA